MHYLFLVFILFSFTNSLQAQDHTEADHVAFFEKAELLRRASNEVEAVEYYQKALRASPNEPDYNLGYGLCLLSLKDYEQALVHLNKALSAKPDDIKNLKAIIICQQALGNDALVLEGYKKLIELENNELQQYDYLKTIISIYYQARSYQEALNYIEKAKELKHSAYDIDLLFVEAKINNSIGQYHITIEAMNQAISMLKTEDPERNAKYYYELGYALQMMGQYEESQEILKHANHGKYRTLAAKLNPEYYVSAAVCYLKIDDFERSKKLLHKALKMQKDHAKAYVLLGQIAERQANQREAIEKYQHALTIETSPKKIAEIYRSLAQVQLDNAQYDAVIKSVNAFLKISSTDDDMLFKKAIAFYKKENYDHSINILKSIVNMDGIDLNNQHKYLFALGMVYLDADHLQLAKDAFKSVKSPVFRSVANIEYEQILLKEKRLASYKE